MQPCLSETQPHYSMTHNMHSTIDNVIMKKWDLHKVIKCEIGAADISDHFSIQVKLNLNSRRKDTVWKLNIGILNKKEVKEQIKNEIKLCKKITMKE